MKHIILLLKQEEWKGRLKWICSVQSSPKHSNKHLNNNLNNHQLMMNNKPSHQVMWLTKILQIFLRNKIHNRNSSKNALTTFRALLWIKFLKFRNRSSKRKQ